MSFYKLKEGFWRGLSVRRLAKELGNDGLVSLLKLCTWVSVHGHECSVLIGMDAKDIEIVAEWRGEPGLFLSVAVAAGCLKQIEGSFYYIPGYIETGAA